MLIVLTTVRNDFSSSQRAYTLETQRLFNDFRDQVSDTAMKVFGNDDWEISSLEGAYDHLHTSTESLVAEEAVDSRGVPDWVAENCVDIFFGRKETGRVTIRLRPWRYYNYFSNWRNSEQWNTVRGTVGS